MDFSTMDNAMLSTLWEASSLNASLKEQIGNELQQRILNNKAFCIEDFFDVIAIKHRTISVEFIPTSDSYNKYGRNVVILNMVIDDVLAQQLIRNIASQKLTYGVINCTISDGITGERNISFNTFDIYEIAVK